MIFSEKGLILRADTILGSTPPKRFVVPGAGHGFDMTLFVGDPGLFIVEDAWKALDEIVKERAAK